MIMTNAEKTAYEIGMTANDRIGRKAACDDPLMEKLIVAARSKSGHEHNRKVLNAWFKGRAKAEKDFFWLKYVS